MNKEFWNDRYAAKELIYGAAPNDFLASMSGRFPRPGRALDIAAGEGRNALYLASLGLEVLAMDQSEVGMAKARSLARERKLNLATQVADLAEFDPPPGSFDVVSSIFVHLPASLRASVHRRMQSWLKPGGYFILEAYAPEQIHRNTGGPKDPALLAPLDTILAELPGLEILHGAALNRTVAEGQFHTGEASVIQVLARQP